MLFQDGRREEALPYVQAASTRGDPRAQYLLGVAHFNGDLVDRDWVRAYSLLTLANGAGLPQAGPAITQMDRYIGLDDRQSGAALARQLELEAEQARSLELAAADLAVPDGAPAQDPSAPSPRPSVQAPGNAPATTPRVPRPIPSVAVSPSVAAARDAVAQARSATGMEDPAQAGASYARPSAAAPAPRAEPAPAPVEVAAAPSPAPDPIPHPAAAAVPAPAAQVTNGIWRVQLGTFGVAGNAERLWNRLSTRPEIAGRERIFLPRGRVTVVQAGGYATRAEAQSACSGLQRAGHDCLVTRN